MSNLWVCIKRKHTLAEIYYKNVHIMTLDVADMNRSNTSYVSLLKCKDVRFKIVRYSDDLKEVDENKWNSEEYNK